MDSADDSIETSPTLLERVKNPQDDTAWHAFVDRYSHKIYAWTGRYGLGRGDREDLTQEVLLKLVEELQSFRYRPDRGGFRKWLKTVTLNAARNSIRAISRRPTATGRSGIHRLIDNVAAVDDLNDSLAHEFNLELLDLAESYIHGNYRDDHWRAYEMWREQSQRGRPDFARISRDTTLSIGAAKMAVKRIKGEIKARVSELDPDPEN